MFTFAEKLKQMSNIEHKDVGVSSLKGTPSRKIYIKTSTEAVYNPEGVTQEYINNHVDGSKIVDGTITNNKIADSTISMGKLDNEVQTKIQQGVDELEQAIAQAIEDAQEDIDNAIAGANTAAQAANTAANELLNDFQGKGTWVWGYPVYAKPEDIGKGYDRGNIVYHEPTDSSYISRIDGNKTEPTGATNTSWQLLISGSDIGKKDIKKYPIPQTGFTYTLKPNIMYEFGYATSLSIDFNSIAMKDGELNEFQFSFISGETTTALTIPKGVIWTPAVNIKANMQYKANIIYNETLNKYFGTIVGWSLAEEEGNNSGQPNNDELIEPIEDAGGMNDKGGE